ncbi:hypothetical protein GCM10011611_25290 [Aliidongia dinghuensis]|uniref:Uncharacterized protein n=1 Tax=Aliidongia dinghuensis TaxID=1867774 RepID=A0A8J2YTJ4_9PROT|nr:hypothetical protein [Aliidongia dinghuensis]GGF18340.1 hypothetical protein GCM10011611_25290 [Aliidongia dinghuensis]
MVDVTRQLLMQRASTRRGGVRPILALVLLAGVVPAASVAVARAAGTEELRVPAGMVLCLSPEAAASKTHVGCWRARGGQKIEVVVPLSTYTQLRLWSTDGSETTIVYAAPAEAEKLDRR